jgi:hypothetical protein
MNATRCETSLMTKSSFAKQAAVCIAILLPISALSPTALAAPLQWTIGSGGNGHFYEGVLFGADINWPQAKTEAENRGGYLATVTSAAEGDFIVSAVIPADAFWQPDSRGPGSPDLFGPWIGGSQPAGSPEPSGNWQWVTGESFSPTFWAAGEPNDVDGEMYLHFYGKFGVEANAWNDYRNDNPQGGGNVRSFVVEYDAIPEPATTALVAALALCAACHWRLARHLSAGTR